MADLTKQVHVFEDDHVGAFALPLETGMGNLEVFVTARLRDGSHLRLSENRVQSNGVLMVASNTGGFEKGDRIIVFG